MDILLKYAIVRALPQLSESLRGEDEQDYAEDSADNSTGASFALNVAVGHVELEIVLADICHHSQLLNPTISVVSHYYF